MKEEKTMKVITEDNEEKEYKILCAFKLPSTNKNYIVYTDETRNEKGEIEVFASIYYPDDDTRLDEVKTQEEWDAIQAVLDNLHEGDKNE